MKVKILKKIVTVFIIALFSAAMLSCREEKKTASAKSRRASKSDSAKITVGFSLDTLAIERWQRDLDIFINTVKEFGADVIVQNAGNSIEEQKRQILYLLERNVDVIVILPRDAEALTEQIQKIKSKGIPVISYDRLILNADIDLYLSINSETVGELMGKGLLNLTNKTNWFCILGAQEDYNMTLILDGLRRSIKGTGVQLNHIFYTDGWNYDLSYQEMVRLLKNDYIPDAVICGNDAVAASVIQAMSQYYPDSGIPVCGQDADISACQYIVQGQQALTIYKPITKLAELAAEYAVRLAKKEDVRAGNYNIESTNNGFREQPVLWLDPVLVNKDNIDKVIIDSGFHNRNSIYKD